MYTIYQIYKFKMNNKFKISVLVGLMSILGIKCSKVDLFGSELEIVYNPENNYDTFISKNYNLEIELFTEENYIHGVINNETNETNEIKYNKALYNEIKIHEVLEEPSEVYFNDGKLEYLQWYYLPEENILEIVNIESDISLDFVIWWNN